METFVIKPQSHKCQTRSIKILILIRLRTVELNQKPASYLELKSGSPVFNTDMSLEGQFPVKYPV